MITHVALLGSAGDLAGRFVLPALAALHAEEPALRVTAADTRGWDDEAFRRHAASRLGDAATDGFLTALTYAQLDAADPDAVAAFGRGLGATEPVVAYLALPPRVFAPAITGLKAAGLPGGSRIAVEKPFGEGAAEAVALNALLGDDDVRVDHVLAMPVTQRLVARRLAGETFDGLAEVEVRWEETIALEGRAGFYDRAGALKDVLQNHMMQLLSIVAMERPAGPEELRDRKVQALRATRATASARARYAGYAQEAGVDPSRETETFVEVLLEVATPRWAGTTFRMRAGKALGRGFKGVVLHRRAGEPVAIEVDRLGEGEPPAYANLLRDVLTGGTALSVRGDEAQEAWRIVTPVLEAWSDGAVPLGEYPAGSDGPARL